MNYKYGLLAAFVSITLTGCFDRNLTTEQLCEKNPGLRCDKLNIDDGQCRIPRTNLIWHRFEVLQDPSESNQVIEYQKVAEYRKCLELASQITPIDQSALKRQRFNALVHSIDELDRITNELQHSNDPATLYFLWSQTGDTQARRRFLQMEGSGKLNSAELQYALATFYANRDAKKTLTLLNNALALTQPGQLNPEILKSLASINQSLGNTKSAYLWAMVAQHFDIPLASERDLKLLFNFAEPSTYTQLEELAQQIATAVEKGTYSASLIPAAL
ncbi:DUF2989 domain-containing protein [Vibrio sp. CAU 1672]|uniref:DUF2989 domain-containing protein n=1 Tax=Vibrio sp. CAU 1672 TaxID=3032594 RepID=UPI0023DC7450|nr:DUF2989 domain-containing protein [Vibrio sp. CAU 1672]MDF2153819.1 DUF2989 domain-containing protein [Vibrio sp. CAU 1672]